METKHVLVKVRPQRVAVLLAENASEEQFMMVVDFLSRLWGGRYCPIIVVDESHNGTHAKQSLAAVRPDVVLSLGIDSSRWSRISDEYCQPRRFGVLNQEFVKQVYITNRFKLITTTRLIQDAWRRHPDLRRENLILYSIKKTSSLSSIVAPTFGIVPDNKVRPCADALKAKADKLGDNCDVPLYLKTCQQMSNKWSWLDFASNYLTRFQIGSFVSPPTVVVSTDNVTDLALFWNLRMQAGVGASGSIVLFPAEDIDDKRSVEALAKWFRESTVRANYCVVRSGSAQEAELQRLARKLRPRLKGSEIKHVDTNSGIQPLPVVIPYDREVHSRIYTSGRTFNFESEKPSFVEDLGLSEAWICDFVKDTETGRALYDLVLPPRSASMQVLNAPFPPKFNPHMDTLGFGPDSINVKCEANTPTLSIGVPSDEELLHEILAERGIRLRKDEKRIRYTQAIRMLGGLKEAFQVLSGSSLKVIEALLVRPLTLGEIKSKARLDGKGQSPSNLMFGLLDKYSPQHARKVGKKRFAEYYQQYISDHVSEENIIEMLAQRGVIRRKWKLPRCGFCDNEYWIDNINITEILSCPGCASIISLGGQVTLGYELNELIRLTVKEGIVAVVLTANFLFNMTSRGFLWIPGAKCSTDDLKADFDIFACCDGHIFAGECKTLVETIIRSRVWREIYEQAEKTVVLAKKAGVEVFVFGSLCKAYPKNFQEKLRRLAGPDMVVTFLGNKDLQTGRKSIPGPEGTVGSMLIEDLLASKSARRKRRRRKTEERIIRF